MCGIVGIYKITAPVDEASLNRATYTLSHRGPDGRGIWLSENKHIGLGHRRLNIMDPEGGSQPMFNSKNNICISVNGEFYEDQKIRKQLIGMGSEFNTYSDSELLIHLYAKYGLKCVEYLRGEFSWVLYDNSKNIMIAARDRFGIKPLCYHYSNNGDLYIASEAKAILASGLAAKWNESALYQAFCFQYTPVNETLFNGIQQVPPGHMLIYDGKELQIKRYWDLDYPEIELEADFLPLSQMLDKELHRSISIRLRTDNAKICCHLSGGVDSATIAAIASQYTDSPIPCFTVSFPHEKYDELNFAKSQAAFLNAPLYEIKVDADAIANVMSDAVYFSEGLAINNHLSAKYILNREIQRLGFKVALSGEGADELFAGYLHFQHDLKPQNFQSNIAQGIYISTDTTLPLNSILKDLGFIPSFVKAKAAIGYKLHQMMDSSSYNSDTIFNNILNKDHIPPRIQKIHPLYKSSYLWIKYALAGYILRTLGDGCEMAHSIEGRVPFLDHHLFALSNRIPIEYKIKNNIEKFILRETVKKYVTPEIIGRKKHPFMAPPLSLLNHDFINDSLRTKHSIPFLNSKKVVKYLDQLPKMTLTEQSAAEPVLMLMLTSSLLAQRYNL